jgi:hypothetical protein
MIYTMNPVRIHLNLGSDRLLITATSESPLVQINRFGPLVKSEHIFNAPVMKKHVFTQLPDTAEVMYHNYSS